MQAAGVLRDGAAPRDGQRQEERIQSRVVKSLAHVLARCQDDSDLVPRNGRQPLAERLSLLLAHARAQHDQMANALDEFSLQAVEMVVALCEHERRAPRVDRLDDVGADALVASVIVHQLLIQRLELHTLVRVGRSRRLKRRGLNEGEMFKRSRSRLHSCIHAVPNRPTLHEDDRVVPVFPRHSCRQPEHEPRLRLPGDLFEAVG